MSNIYQYIILKKLLVVTFYSAKVVGLWPFELDNLNSQIKLNFFAVIYSVILASILLYGYLKVGYDVFSASVSKFSLGSLTMELVSTFYTYIVIFSFIALYVALYFQVKKIRYTFSLCKKAVDLMRAHQFSYVDFRKYLFYFLLKTIIYDGVNLSIMFYNIRSSSHIVQSKPYLALCIILPILPLRLYVNIFYGGLLITNVCFKQVNNSLADILYRTKENSKLVPKNKYLFMKNYCKLSDELDKLSKVYFQLNQAIRAFSSVFSFQIVLWVSAQLTFLIIEHFYQYVAIVQFIRTHNRYALQQICTIFIVTLNSMYDLFSTSYACDSLVTEANQTAIILHTTKLNRNVDIRFKRSIDIFSTQILSNKLKITECGMFDLNLTTVHSIVSSIVSYCLILIQFELASKPK